MSYRPKWRRINPYNVTSTWHHINSCDIIATHLTPYQPMWRDYTPTLGCPSNNNNKYKYTYKMKIYVLCIRAKKNTYKFIYLQTTTHWLLYKWTEHGKLYSNTKINGLPTPSKIKVSNSKLIDLVIIIMLTRAIWMPRFSNFLRNSIIMLRMFLYLEACFLRVTVSLLCRLQAVSEMHAPIYPYLISKGRRNCSTLWMAQQRNRDSRETCYQILKKKHEKMDGRISQKILVLWH